MKRTGKLLLPLIVLTLIFSIFPTTVFAADEVSVTIDGKVVNFVGQNPVIVGGEVLVPIRGVFEALGFDVNWNQTHKRLL